MREGSALRNQGSRRTKLTDYLRLPRLPRLYYPRMRVAHLLKTKKKDAVFTLETARPRILRDFSRDFT